MIAILQVVLSAIHMALREISRARPHEGRGLEHGGSCA